MSINATGVTNYTSTANTQVKKNQINTEDFFSIISAQLKYQDPMQGGDNTQFISQLVQFAELDGIDKLNNSLGSIVGKSDLDFSFQLLGKDIKFKYGEDALEGTVENFSVKNGTISLKINGEAFSLNQISEIEIYETKQVTDNNGGALTYDV